MMRIERFEDLEAWQLARQLNRNIYALTRKGAFSQDFGLKDQIQDAAGSAMHNTAEGFDAGSTSEFCRFLRYSRRSSTEVQSQLYVALDQNYITSSEFEESYELAGRVRSVAGGLIKYLISKRKPKDS